MCVSTTARQAAELVYDVVLAKDAIGDRDIPGMSGKEVTKFGFSGDRKMMVANGCRLRFWKVRMLSGQW